MFVMSKAQEAQPDRLEHRDLECASVCVCACMVCVLYLQLGTSKQKKKKKNHPLMLNSPPYTLKVNHVSPFLLYKYLFIHSSIK